MSRKLNFRTRAQLDVVQQQDWYVEQLAFDAAFRFGEAVVDLLDRLLVEPGVGRKESEPNASLVGLRSTSVVGFEAMRIYYIDRLEVLDVVRVLHTSRDVAAILVGENHDGTASWLSPRA